MLSVKQLGDLLLEVQSEPILGLQLMTKITTLERGGQLNGLAMLDFAPDIQRAVVELGDLSSRSERISRQCLELKAKATHRVPIGF